MKRKEECFIGHPNTEKWLEKNETQPSFLTNFSVFGYLMKHSFECLIYYCMLKALIIVREIQSIISQKFMIIGAHIQTSVTVVISFLFSS